MKHEAYMIAMTMKRVVINTAVLFVVFFVGCVVLILTGTNRITGGRLCRKLYDMF